MVFAALDQLLKISDTSLLDFFTELNNCIDNDSVENSFKTFKYDNLNYRNELYEAIQNVKSYNEFSLSPIRPTMHDRNPSLLIDYVSTFCSDLPYKGVEFIKRIDNIKMYEHHKSIGEGIKGVRRTGTYYLEFTVYYEKSNKLKIKCDEINKTSRPSNCILC
jgi:hypothetical protein